MHTVIYSSPEGKAHETIQRRVPLRQRWGIFCPLTTCKQ